MTKNPASVANSAVSTNALRRTQVVRTPLRLAERSSNPTERNCSPEPLA